MNFVGRYSSNLEVGRQDTSTNPYRASTNHFYTPSRQNAQASYGRGSSSGPGSTTTTSRFTLAQKKAPETADLRQSMASRTQTQSASKYPSYDYSQRRIVDLGISQLGEAAKTTSYSKPYYRTTGTHDYSQYSSLDRPSTTFTNSKYQGVGTYSRYSKDIDLKKSTVDTPGPERREDPKNRDSIQTFTSSLAKDNVKPPKGSSASNFEESNLY